MCNNSNSSANKGCIYEILKTILHEGSISEEQVQSIILTNAELRKGLKEDVTLDIKIYEKE